VKLNRQRADAFLRAPTPDIHAALIYGPDRGLVRETSEKLIGAIVDDIHDPFRVSVLTGAELKADPVRLVDDAAAISMMGGRRVVVVRADGDDISRAVATYLEADVHEALVVIEAGDLPPRSALRKSMEADAKTVAIACYRDDGASLDRLIDDVMRAHEVSLNRDARSYLLANLGGDRLASRQELEKLALYAGEKGEVSVEDVVEAIGDSAALSMDDVIHAAADGDLSQLDRLLVRALADGIAPVSLLRSAQRHFQRLQLAQAMMKSGRSAQDAMKALRPPVIFLHTNRFGRQLQRWSASNILLAQQLLVDAELDCKSTGLPEDAVCSRTFLRIAHAAGR